MQTIVNNDNILEIKIIILLHQNYERQTSICILPLDVPRNLKLLQHRSYREVKPDPADITLTPADGVDARVWVCGGVDGGLGDVRAVFAGLTAARQAD